MSFTKLEKDEIIDMGIILWPSLTHNKCIHTHGSQALVRMIFRYRTVLHKIHPLSLGCDDPPNCTQPIVSLTFQNSRRWGLFVQVNYEL